MDIHRANDHAGTVHLHHVPLPGETTEEKEIQVVMHDEQLPSNEVIHKTKSGAVYKTRNGLELIPTPSNDPNDPLNWPFMWKMSVLICVCLSSLMVAFSAAGIIPGFTEIVRFTPARAGDQYLLALCRRKPIIPASTVLRIWSLSTCCGLLSVPSFGVRYATHTGAVLCTYRAC
jgi:hypothetical protein